VNSYRLFLRESSHSPDAIRFDCEADDVVHAIEQATNAYPDGEVVSLTMTDAPSTIVGCVLRENEADFEVHPDVDEGSFWLSIANASLLISQRDGALGVVVFQRGREDDDGELARVRIDFDDLRPDDAADLHPRSIAAHKRFAPSTEDLWESLKDVPVNDRDEIEVAWRHFKAGTHREDIWRWFEATFPGFSVAKAQGHP
jgi:hypothetical protein